MSDARGVMRSCLVLVALDLVALVNVAGGEAAAARWYDCTAWGSSHTGRYTFRIATEPCGVYWREIDAHLDIEVCAPPRIVAVKPFAVSSGYVVEFDLDTGGFEDFTPSFSDRGRCEVIEDPSD